MSATSVPSHSPVGLPYQPRPGLAHEDDAALADCRGKRIGILVVTYNALATIVPVLKRIPPADQVSPSPQR